MKTDQKIIEELDRLIIKYEVEIEQKRRNGILADKTAKTYLLHSNNFVRWCKGEFIPGERNI